MGYNLPKYIGFTSFCSFRYVGVFVSLCWCTRFVTLFSSTQSGHLFQIIFQSWVSTYALVEFFCMLFVFVL
eukprot:TRINITY_DN14597_c0_g1_i1.p2 TRINITY_DN14597_c0_g1~~TRINITY_DN14597_c0_g1_i1.p2  ORF type:complete len:80 (+),score=6.88 TRINITY_DN14597_c0_g1_i1:28-240(+)